MAISEASTQLWNEMDPTLKESMVEVARSANNGLSDEMQHNVAAHHLLELLGTVEHVNELNQ